MKAWLLPTAAARSRLARGDAVGPGEERVEEAGEAVPRRQRRLQCEAETAKASARAREGERRSWCALVQGGACRRHRGEGACWLWRVRELCVRGGGVVNKWADNGPACDAEDS